MSSSTTIGAGTIGNSPAWTLVSGSDSLMAVDTNSTTVSGASVILSIYLAPTDGLFVDLKKHGLLLTRDNYLIITALSTSTPTVSVSLGWTETL